MIARKMRHPTTKHVLAICLLALPKSQPPQRPSAAAPRSYLTPLLRCL